jgi:hypothetical protein
MKKPEVGQTLYRLNVNNAARHCKQELTPVVVKSVGRKYFVCGLDGSWADIKYYIDSWGEVTNYTPDSALYENPQEWEDEREASNIRNDIRIIFSYGQSKSKDLTLEQLRAIRDIVTPPPPHNPDSA